jgi:hypothetical protein
MDLKIYSLERTLNCDSTADQASRFFAKITSVTSISGVLQTLYKTSNTPPTALFYQYINHIFSQQPCEITFNSCLQRWVAVPASPSCVSSSARSCRPLWTLTLSALVTSTSLPASPATSLPASPATSLPVRRRKCPSARRRL